MAKTKPNPDKKWDISFFLKRIVLMRFPRQIPSFGNLLKKTIGPTIIEKMGNSH